MGALVLLVVCIARVRAQVPVNAPDARGGPVGVTGDPAPTPEERLAGATSAYLQGDVARSRALLQALLADGPALPAPVRREALAYLGDILYSEQGAEASRSVFEALLREAPTYRMDPYAHPAPVCAWVEAVRADMRARAVAPPADVAAVPRPAPTVVASSDAPVRSFPAVALVPGGVHLFRAGRPWAGAALASVQLGGLAVSVATRSRIDAAFAARSDDPDIVARLVWVNRGAAAVAWLAWGVPAAVEVTRWSSGRRAANVRVSPAGVRLDGTF